MSYRDNCGICGESYNDDNLIDCASCGRSFCYRCGDSGNAICSRCLEKARLKEQERQGRNDKDSSTTPD